MKKTMLRLLVVLFIITTTMCLTTVTTFATEFERDIVQINNGWKFKFNQGSSFGTDIDDSAWAQVDLPHTWNAEDGVDSGSNYARGKGMYRKTVTIPAEFEGKRIYIAFKGVNAVSTLYIDGELVPFVMDDGTTGSSHKGGYTQFRYDITDLVTPGASHIFAVCADNTRYEWIAPIDADFTFYGGIYRDVELIAVAPIHFDLLDNGSDGLYISALKNTDEEWTVTIKTTITNDTDLQKTVGLSTVIREPEVFESIEGIDQSLTAFDEASMTGTAILAEESIPVILEPYEKKVVTRTYSVTNPRLWNGTADPFRYFVTTTITEGSAVLDRVSDHFGFRTYYADANNGFFLNGVSYPLRGVSRHQDFDGVGNAINTQMQDTDLAILVELGANTVRLAHYPHCDYFYDLCDRYGIVVWAETPFISYIGGTGDYGAFDENRTLFFQNVKTQFVELIRSQYNHPSIFFWSIQNEVDIPYDSLMKNIMEKELYPLVKAEDPSRLATFATFHEQGFSWKADLVGLNFYPAWYGYEVQDFTTEVLRYHRLYPDLILGISEYGAGGSPSQHTEGIHRPEPFGDPFHPEEYQTYVHENIARQIYSGQLDFLWATYVWNLFDFGSDKRCEGDRFGINDKGLVTFDRSLKKDAFYVYKAIWSAEPFVHLQRKRFETRDCGNIIVKASSNCDTLSITVNGQPFGSPIINDGIGQFAWENVPLNMGENTVTLTGVKDDVTYTDTVVWTRVPSDNVGISSSSLKIDNAKKSIVLRTAVTVESIGSLVKTDSLGATLSVLSPDKTTVITSGGITPRMYLRVTSESGAATADYQFVSNNIAFNKTVVAEGKNYNDFTDGKTSAITLNSFGLSKQLTVLLERPYYVTNLHLFTKYADCQYTVSVSTDGVNYRTISHTKTTSNTKTVLGLGGVEAKNIRIDIIAPESIISLSEIEVDGWNFDGTDYSVHEGKRLIVTNTGTNQVPDGVFLESLDITGNCIFEIERNSSVFYISDGDKLKLSDPSGSIIYYTICTGNDCTNNHSNNIALGKPLKISDNGQSGRLPKYINDGIIGNSSNDISRWQASSSSYPQWVIIDLGDVYSIEKYNLTTFAAAYNDRYYGYKVYSGTDEDNFTLIHDMSSNKNQSGIHSKSFTSTYGRYIKLEITNSSKGSAGIYEFEIYGSVAEAIPTDLDVKYKKVILGVDSTEKISLEIIPGHAEPPVDIVYNSLDNSIATVNSDGIITGVSKGNTTINLSSASLGKSIDIAVTVSDKHNLSVNRPIITHTNPDQSSSVSIKNFNDGSIETRWQGGQSASASNPTIITVDLEKQCTITDFEASFFNPENRVHYYEILVSTDNQTYTTAVNNLNNSSYNMKTYTHRLSEPVTARYVQLKITGQSAGSTPGVMEFSVYGESKEIEITCASFDKEFICMAVGEEYTPIITIAPNTANPDGLIWNSTNPSAVTAVNGVITAVGLGNAQISVSNSSGKILDTIDVFSESKKNLSIGKKVIDYDDYGYLHEPGTGYKNTVENLTDGMIPSDNLNFPRWHFNDRNTHYAVIDLEKIYKISDVKMYFFYYTQRAYGYEISVSVDGTNYTTVLSKLDNDKMGIQSETFNIPVYARYVRLDVTAPTNKPGSTTGVYEFSIYGEELSGDSMDYCSIYSDTAHQAANIIFASYYQNKLLSVKVLENASIASGNNIVIIPDALVKDTADTIKVMVWKPFTTLEPILDVKTISLDN